METVLLTGGAGYIGSHTAVALLGAGYETVIADDLTNSEAGVIDRIKTITGRSPRFYNINVLDAAALDRVFEENEISAVLHFAGFKSVANSVKDPVGYYKNNVGTTITLLETMKKHGCGRFVFSSSATVYGCNNPIPYTEAMPTGSCASPYGWTKFVSEQILFDAARADSAFSAVILRYFNPIGAHESGLIGEKPNGVPDNLMPYITQLAAGKRDVLRVFGNDYPTRDGTGVRDYIHVCDLAAGHLAALDYSRGHTGAEAFNLGTGRGVSVLELVRAFERVNGLSLPLEYAPRRPGDLAEYYADAGKAERVLGWHAEKTIDDMCRDSWRWQKNSENL